MEAYLRAWLGGGLFEGMVGWGFIRGHGWVGAYSRTWLGGGLFEAWLGEGLFEGAY